MSEMNWTCHICGDERPDRFISVMSKPMHFAGGVVAQTNVRYCNDKDSCVAAAPTHDLFPIKEVETYTDLPDPPPFSEAVKRDPGKDIERVIVIVIALVFAIVAVALALSA